MKRVLVLSLTAFFALAAVAVAAAKFTDVKPQEFDPNNTELVQAAWVDGIGCPTGAKTQEFGSTTPAAFTAGGCPTGDDKDKHNQGLLLAKTGPSSNFASATATLKNVKGATVEELGFDLRKPTDRDDPRGSHCTNGAPRFNVITSAGLTFIGCGELTQEDTGDGWMRLRYDGPPIADVQSIEIVADEGQDVAEDEFGVSILDNIDVNGTLVGQGPKDSD